MCRSLLDKQCYKQEGKFPFKSKMSFNLLLFYRVLQPKVFVQFVCVPFNSCARKIDSFSPSSGHMGVDDTTHFATTVSAGIFDKQLVHNFTWGSPGVWCGKKKPTSYCLQQRTTKRWKGLNLLRKLLLRTKLFIGPNIAPKWGPVSYLLTAQYYTFIVYTLSPFRF